MVTGDFSHIGGGDGVAKPDGGSPVAIPSRAWARGAADGRHTRRQSIDRLTDGGGRPLRVLGDVGGPFGYLYLVLGLRDVIQLGARVEGSIIDLFLLVSTYATKTFALTWIIGISIGGPATNGWLFPKTGGIYRPKGLILLSSKRDVWNMNEPTLTKKNKLHPNKFTLHSSSLTSLNS